MNNKRIVLHVVDRLTGGVPIAVRDYIGSTKNEYRHAIAAPFVDKRVASVWAGVDADHFDLGHGHLRRMRSIRRTTRILRPDVIHAHSSYAGAYARLAVPHAGRRVVYSPHCFKFDDPACGPLHRHIYLAAERLLSYRTLRFAVLSTHESKLAQSLRPSVPRTLVPNRPSLPEVQAGPRATSRVIAMCGRIADQKDPRFYIRLVKELRSQEGADIRAVWIGDGEGELRRELEDANVEITGWLPPDDLMSVLDGVGVYAHTASYEGFPLSVLDAIARALPVVVRNIAAFDDTSLMRFETPGEGARLIRRLLDGQAFRETVRTASRGLLDRMSEGSQRAALQSAWNGGTR